MTKQEEEIRDESVMVWQSAYMAKRDKHSQPESIQYANKKAYKYLYKKLGKA